MFGLGLAKKLTGKVAGLAKKATQKSFGAAKKATTKSFGATKKATLAPLKAVGVGKGGGEGSKLGGAMKKVGEFKSKGGVGGAIGRKIAGGDSEGVKSIGGGLLKRLSPPPNRANRGSVSKMYGARD